MTYQDRTDEKLTALALGEISAKKIAEFRREWEFCQEEDLWEFFRKIFPDADPSSVGEKKLRRGDAMAFICHSLKAMALKTANYYSLGDSSDYVWLLSLGSWGQSCWVAAFCCIGRWYESFWEEIKHLPMGTDPVHPGLNPEYWLLRSQYGRKLKKFSGDLVVGHADIILNKDVNILVGFNGSGKTILLEALAHYAHEQGICCSFYRGVMPREEINLRRSLDCLQGSNCFPDKVLKSFQEKNFSLNAHYSQGEVALLSLTSFLLEECHHNVLLFENFEWGMHLGIQRYLIDLCQEVCPCSQLILATHSPAVIMKGWLDNVFQMEDIISK